MSNSTTAPEGIDYRVKILALCVIGAVAGAAFSFAAKALGSVNGAEKLIVTICGDKLLADSGKTLVRTSNGTYRVDNTDATQLKRGGVYEITTESGWTFGDFSLKRTIVSASQAPEILGGECR